MYNINQILKIMSKKLKIVTTLIILLLIISCQYEKFALNKEFGNRIDGLIMTHYDSVRQINDNSIFMKSETKVALRSEFVTQFVGDFTVKIPEGEGINFYFRTAVDKFEIHPAIKFDYSFGGSKVYENNVLIRTVDTVMAKPNQEVRIKIMNYGKHYIITVDCDTVIHKRTDIPLTEFIIIETRKNTKAEIYGINFDEIYDWIAGSIKNLKKD